MAIKPDLIDRDQLNLAIADHAKTVVDIAAHRTELANLQTQINELDSEITKLGIQLKDFDLNKDMIGIADIKAYAQEKLRIQFELEALAEVRDGLKKQYPVLERDYSRLDSMTESDEKRHCWAVLYDGLLKAIDTESLKQLIVVGVASGKHEKNVIADLGLSIEYPRLEALAKQFKIPV